MVSVRPKGLCCNVVSCNVIPVSNRSEERENIMSPLVLELLKDLGTDECVAALTQPVDTRDIAGDYDGMAFDPDRDAYLRYIGQVGH